MNLSTKSKKNIKKRLSKKIIKKSSKKIIKKSSKKITKKLTSKKLNGGLPGRSMLSNSVVVKSGGTGYETLMDGGRNGEVVDAAARVADSLVAVEELQQLLDLAATEREVVAASSIEAWLEARELLDEWINSLNRHAASQGAEEAVRVVDGGRVARVRRRGGCGVRN